MKLLVLPSPMRTRLGSQVAEYTIIAILIATGLVFSILLFGKATQTKMDDATQVVAGNIGANRLANTPSAAPDQTDAQAANGGQGRSGGGSGGGSATSQSAGGGGESGGSGSSGGGSSSGSHAAGGGGGRSGGERTVASRTDAAGGGGGDVDHAATSGINTGGDEASGADSSAMVYTVKKRPRMDAYQVFFILLLTFAGAVMVAAFVSNMKKKQG